jgi:hypothetical protein
MQLSSHINTSVIEEEEEEEEEDGWTNPGSMSAVSLNLHVCMMAPNRLFVGPKGGSCFVYSFLSLEF